MRGVFFVGDWLGAVACGAELALVPIGAQSAPSTSVFSRSRSGALWRIARAYTRNVRRASVWPSCSMTSGAGRPIAQRRGDLGEPLRGELVERRVDRAYGRDRRRRRAPDASTRPHPATPARHRGRVRTALRAAATTRARGRDGAGRRTAERDPTPTHRPRRHLRLPPRHRQRRGHQHRQRPHPTDDVRQRRT